MIIESNLKYLLDTCVVSELIKTKPNLAVTKWIQNTEETEETAIYISVLTLGEIYKGITKQSDAVRKRRLQTWVDEDLSRLFAGRILAITPEIAQQWGIIQGDLEKQGNKMPDIDGLIAVTAVVHNLVLVTRNEKDVQKSGVRILNLWL